jgi:hypothetical protein
MTAAERNKSILVVKYEDMVEKQKESLERVATFTGMTCTEQDISLTLSRSSFTEMQRNEQRHGAEAYRGESAKRGPFIRRGRIDGWKEELAPGDNERIQQAFAPVMKACGYI